MPAPPILGRSPRPGPPRTSEGSILGSGDPLGEWSALGSAGLGLQPVGELRRVVPAALLVACRREGMCEGRHGETEGPHSARSPPPTARAG